MSAGHEVRKHGMFVSKADSAAHCPTVSTAARRRGLSPDQLAELQRRLKGEYAAREAPSTLGTPDIRAARLSYQQRRFWLLAQVDRRPDASICIRFTGDLQLIALKRALTILVERHELLRTRFEMPNDDGLPIQVVDSPYEPALTIHDVGSDANPEAAASRLIGELVSRPFDFSSARVEFVLIRLSKKDQMLFAAMQHANTDGHSVEIFLHELAAIYDATLRGEIAELPVLPASYAGYAEWQHREASSPSAAKQLDYWTRQLADVPLTLDFPVDFPPSENRQPNGATLTQMADEIIRAKLDACCSQLQATPFMVLMAAFQIVIFRYTGCPTFVVCAPTAGRNIPELEGLFGCFINTLPIRAEIPDEEISFADLVDHVRRTALAAYDNQDIPIELVVDALNPPHDSAMPPLSQLWFDMRTFHRAPSISGVSARLHNLVPPPRFNLSVVVRMDDSQLSISLEYPDDLFREQTISLILDCYWAVLLSALDDPQIPVNTVRWAP